MINNKKTNKGRVIADVTSWTIAILWIIIMCLGIYTFIPNIQRVEPKATPEQECTVPEKEYTVKGKVVYIDGDLFTLATTDGNEWECYADGYSVDDVVEITFNNNKTINIYDDSIVGLQKLSD